MRRGDKQDGYILVAVLGVMLLLTGFIAAGSMLIRSALDTAKVGDADAAMVGLTRGGLELAAYQLFVIKAAPDAVEGRRISFADGIVSPHIVDEGGKADLNTSDPKLLASIFQSAGLDGGTADALLTYLTTMRGAPRPSPTSTATPPGKKPQLRGFQSVDQLGEVPDLSRADLRALRPLLTVYNPDGRIDILTASRALLAAIPGMSAADVSLILARRDGADRKEIERLTAVLKGAQAYIKTKPGPAYTVRVDATSARGLRKSINAVIAASKSPNAPYYVLDWWE